ncbi:MAG: energy-coupling factor transporter transmembrane component T [Clostridia bacterium]|mgnify:CR=1 FL=1|nr:energy-coupling factor transporter transmembrane component T [Clostridia bacterium]
MHIAAVDHMANNGDSFLHHALPFTKVIMSFLFLAALIFSNQIHKAVFLLVIPVAFILLSGVNVREIFHLALYSIVFSLLFALIQLQQSWTAAVMVMIKALGAALNMLLLIATTPYTDIFAVFSHVLPGVIIDLFIFTYRSLFILIDKLEDMVKSVRLRGGLHPMRLLFNLKNAAGALGVMTIHAFDMSERLYRIYSLRGYNGKIPITREWGPLRWVDILLLLFSLIVLTGVLIPWKI